jgi:predicted DNA-binding transcriptional regulator AlpA
MRTKSRLKSVKGHPSPRRRVKPDAATVMPSTPIVLIHESVVRARVGGEKTPISKATMYRAIAEGRLPKPVHPTANTSRWIEAEVDEAIANAARAR